MPVEIWKPVVGYEGLYEVSSIGRVKSIKRNTAINRILKPHNTKKYFQVCLCKNGIIAYKSVHRLVAEAFIPNPDNLPEVNHKDENKLNNEISNLEWISRSSNLKYGTRLERIGKAKSKAVKALNDEGVLVGEYESINEAAEATGLAPINISRCCRGIYKRSGGYIWQYIE